MIKFVAILTLFLFFSCALSPRKDPGPGRLDQVTGLPPHMISKCEIYDLSGKLLRHIAGHMCLYEKDGTTYQNRGGHLTKYDRHFNIIWEEPVTFMHHQFTKSVVDDSLLTLESRFKLTTAGRLREDVINVRDAGGKIIKSVNFSKLMNQLKEKKQNILEPSAVHWFDWFFNDGRENFETSHINSFAETYEESDGRKVLTGYLVYCNHQKKIVFLSANLQTVTGFIDTAGRYIHNLRMLNPQKLIFYQNLQELPSKAQSYSSVQTFDLKTQTFSELYSAHSPSFSGRACGSVQVLSDNQLFITHSNCILSPDSVKLTSVEYVNLLTREQAVHVFSESKFISNMELLDLTEYLKNNPGL